MAAGEEELLNPGVQPLESAVPAGRSSSAGHVIHLPDLAGLDEASLQALLDRLTPRLQQGLQHSIASLHVSVTFVNSCFMMCISLLLYCLP
jgi:hypothetical protein